MLRLLFQLSEIDKFQQQQQRIPQDRCNRSRIDWRFVLLKKGDENKAETMADRWCVL